MNENSDFKSSIDDEKIELFLNEVLKVYLLPNAKVMQSFAMGPVGINKCNHVSLGLSEKFSQYKNSNYFYEGKYKFIHYTSIPKLINILRDKKIRLYDLRAMDDKDEFNFAHKVCGESTNFTINEAKKRIFCLSMCKYELEEREESLNMWRQFGNDGFGAGIVFNFAKTHRNNWINYMLN